jgi:predicted nucleic acid-binding protein
LATHLDHPVYDCLYLVLAYREVVALLSADQRLLKLAARVLA